MPKYYNVRYTSELMHHGISGQKWGVKNGPPYPLDRKVAGNSLYSDFNKLPNGPEDLETATKNSNPDFMHMRNSCVPDSIAAFLRSVGVSCKSKGTGGKQVILGGVVEACFKNPKVLDGKAVKFGKSRQDAEEYLKKKFGDNAKGNVSIQWKEGNRLGAKGGHAFNWEIKDGNVAFSNEVRDNKTINIYWNYIDQNDSMTICRLDGSELNREELENWVEFE